MLVVPLQPLPNQELQVQLGGQALSLTVYQTTYALFVDVYVGTTLICGGVIARNLNRIVRAAYTGFVGDLAFVDTQGTDDPVYTGLGSRWQLVYLEAGDNVPSIQ